MAERTQANRAAVPVPPAYEYLYVGIDVGKYHHAVCVVSVSLLERHGTFERCPVFVVPNNRDGFHQLLEHIQTHGPAQRCVVLVESTGHYHRLLVDYLQEQGIPVYWMHVNRKPSRLEKTDARDARGLANRLYGQIECGVQ